LATRTDRSRDRALAEILRAASHCMPSSTKPPKPAGSLPAPPKPFLEFSRRHPKLAAAWELLHDAGDVGPLDERTRRLVKLAVAIGALREGAVRASARKAVALGISREEIDQIVALGAGTLGMPASVAVSTWIEAAFDPSPKPGGRNR
jgi:4-carboxymuconolactone decarboxylase